MSNYRGKLTDFRPYDDGMGRYTRMCREGHYYNATNTSRTNKGGRICKTCRQNAGQRATARRDAARALPPVPPTPEPTREELEAKWAAERKAYRKARKAYRKSLSVKH